MTAGHAPMNGVDVGGAIEPIEVIILGRSVLRHIGLKGIFGRLQSGDVEVAMPAHGLFFLPFAVHQGFDGQAIARQTEPHDDALAHAAEHRLVAKGLALIEVADVHLDHRCRNGTDAVVQGDARVAVTTSIEHHTIAVKAHRLQLVDELALDIALEIIYLHVGELCTQGRQIALKRAVAIDRWFAPT